MIDLDELTACTETLAPLPKSAVRLANLFGQAEWDLDEVEGVVRLDAPLTGRILGLVNSAAVGGLNEISDVGAALIGTTPTASPITLHWTKSP